MGSEFDAYVGSYKEIIDRSAGGSDGMIDSRHASDEFQVFPYRKILIEAETLRHVTDVSLDFIGFRADVITQARSGSLIRREKTA